MILHVPRLTIHRILFIVPEWPLTRTVPIADSFVRHRTGNRQLQFAASRPQGLPTSAPYGFLIGTICHCKVYKARSFTTQKKIAPCRAQHLSSVSGRNLRRPHGMRGTTTIPLLLQFSPFSRTSRTPNLTPGTRVTAQRRRRKLRGAKIRRRLEQSTYCIHRKCRATIYNVILSVSVTCTLARNEKTRRFTSISATATLIPSHPSERKKLPRAR